MSKTQGGNMSPRTDDIDVRSQLAVMNAQIEILTKTVDVLAEEVKSLTALANQGKGSLRTLLIVGGWDWLWCFSASPLVNLSWK
jgi:hypothetical protein